MGDVYEGREKANEDFSKRQSDRVKARKMSNVESYQFVPYINLPKKMGYGKLRAMIRYSELDRLESKPVAKDVPQQDGIALMQLSSDQAQKEYDKRKKKANHGFKKLHFDNRGRQLSGSL